MVDWYWGTDPSMRENWLSTERQSSPMGPPSFQARELKVSDLLLPNAEWDIELIQKHLPHHETQTRKLVPCTSLEDERIWLLEKVVFIQRGQGTRLLK